jgi:hypothetical protein
MVFDPQLRASDTPNSGDAGITTFLLWVNIGVKLGYNGMGEPCSPGHHWGPISALLQVESSLARMEFLCLFQFCAFTILHLVSFPHPSRRRVTASTNPLALPGLALP